MPHDPADELRAVVGRDHVLVDDDVRRGYEVDWTGRYGGTSVAVVRPRDTADVADVLAVCRAHGLHVVTQGGNTGLVGGSVPRNDGSARTVVLSMRRFDRQEPVDVAAMQVTVGAGVTLAAWRDHARAAGLDTPVDFAARQSATVGGAIATNAGGSRVVRFGTMRQQVLGVEAVLGDGSIVGSLSGLPKETVGLHWPSLLAGSEGTLGVLTRARLRLVPWYPDTITALVATSSLADAVALLGVLRRDAPSLDSVELVLPGAMDLVATHLGVAPPVRAPSAGAYVVVECAADRDPSAELETALGGRPEVLDAAVTSDPAQRDRLVQFRDRLTEAISAAATASGTPTFKLDVAVPVGALDELMAVATAAAARDGARLVAFGHLAEGNLHLNHLDTRDPESIAATVLPEVARLGGTISAEHGVGVAKVPWLHLVRRAGDLAAQAAIAAAVDPDRIMNPGVLRSV